MAETTYTRKTLRRAISRELRMPFFRRYPDGESTVDTGSTASLIKDTSLVQKDKFWNGKWFYALDTEEVALIRHFEAANRQFILEPPLTAALSETGPTYEIHSGWSASEIHDAINRAIEKAGRIFLDTVTDKSLILQEDKLSYTVSGLTKTPYRIHKVWVENSTSVTRGTATAGGASTITVQSVPSGITTSYKISIYEGTGKGQVRNYSSAVGLQVTVDSPWVTNPSTDSKYAIWDATEEVTDWLLRNDWYEDSKEFPDIIYFRTRLTANYGTRIRIEYSAISSPLSSDTDTTIIPQDYIIAKACSILHGQRLGVSTANYDLHDREHRRLGLEADSFLAQYAPHTNDSSLRDSESPMSYDESDPLNWRNQ